MVPLEFGVTLPFVDIADFARRAEDLGYQYVTSGEHVTFHGPQANAFITLSVAAGATERIKLLSTVTLLPLYPAALAAKMAAMLDVASDGRFNLGVGIGGEYPGEFDACGVPVRQRGARVDEALAVVSRLLSGETVSFEGRFNRFRDVSILPRPIQAPRPPIWVAGRKDAAMRRAARYGDAWMPYMYTPEQLRHSLETIRSYLEAEGRSPQSVRGALYTFVCVYPDGARAKRVAAEVVGEIYRQDFSRLVDRYIVAGTPEQCQARMEQYVEAGASAVMINLACPDDERIEMMERFARDVIPALTDVSDPARSQPAAGSADEDVRTTAGDAR